MCSLHLLCRVLPQGSFEGYISQLVIIAVDFGTKNIGVAHSPDGVFAFPLCTIERKSDSNTIIEIVEISRKHKAELLVFGYPASNIESQSAKDAIEFAQKLTEELDIPVELVDESLTSIEARAVGHTMGKTDKDMRKGKDAIEAQIILMRYLERNN